jgi:hypothetical protein
MNDEDSQGREYDVRERIAGLIRSIGRGSEKQITTEERRELKAAADRLDQMLKAAADIDQQALRDAAVRLDRLLVDIREGKDISNNVKRRQDRRERTR